MGACTAGTCAGNSSGKSRSSPLLLFVGWLALYSLSLHCLLESVEGPTFWLRCCWGRGLQTSQAVSGKWNTSELICDCIVDACNMCDMSLALGCTRKMSWRVLWSGASPKATSFRWRWLSEPDSSTSPSERWA